MANLHDTVVQVSHTGTCATGTASPVWLPSQIDGVRLVEDVENGVSLRIWVGCHPLYDFRPPLHTPWLVFLFCIINVAGKNSCRLVACWCVSSLLRLE